MDCLESLSLLLKRTTLRFFFSLKNCKQKERDIHGHIPIHIEIYTEYFQCGVYLPIEIHTECLHSPLHTYPHPYIQHVNINVSVLGSSLEFVY